MERGSDQEAQHQRGGQDGHPLGERPFLDGGVGRLPETRIEIPAEALERLKTAGSLAVLTGAGVSAESGLPTFRGKDGLWKNHRPEQLATPQAFSADPKLVWDWYHWRRGIVRNASPNPAHLALVEMEKRIENFTLITQNVDGLHRRAGSREVLEIHGNLCEARCSVCPASAPLEEEEGIVTCEACGAFMRPAVVWFGESLDTALLEKAYVRAGGSDMFIVAGTSGMVQPAASLSYAALRGGGYVLEVNLDPTPLTGEANATILGKAGDILPELVRRVWTGGMQSA
ncbi:MAG: NAD-dependent deacylase [bacterium]|nr:MAG: NAD-dependent deacylase [bacterium]